ncbi:MAG TPA: BTAD domain-containing putative transcriptional regulator [Gaiellaceae bacterium]|nr:BTAD domain-containing putative transcriptional regulator [Gaiellaceae bacterium]
MALGGQKRRALLAVLLLDANSVVSGDRLIDALWGDSPPETARNTIQVYISQLRKLLPESALETAPPGYRLVIEPDNVDLFEFIRLSEEGRTALGAGDAAGGADTLRAALALWRGAPLADLAWEPFAQAEIVRLEELRLAALEDRIDADLALGRHGQLIGELEQLVAEHPLKERLRAQLMLALYRSGRQADALAVYQRARRTLVDELGIEPSDSLKQLELAILAHDPALSLDAPLAAPPSPRQVPTPPTPLLGRESELAALADLVRREDARLVTLTGIGGIGKTRLALELVRRLAPEFQHGSAVVTLATLREPELVARTILEALAIPEAGQDPEEVLTAELQGTELLLLVDNFEQVLPAAGSIARLLDTTPGLKVIVTSRAPLHVAAEREFPVPPLADDEAAELFIARAHAANPNFVLSERNAGAVAEICTRLEGLPLAIELAAARTKLLPPVALLSRLGNRLELLTGGRRDAPQHQQTLRMTLDWSYDLLEPDAQRLFARLGVFAGGCTLESAEAVCGGDGSVLEGLAALVDESLVRQRETDTGEPRFSMLEIVREYALERLSGSGDGDETRRRHLEHFVSLAEEAEPKLADRDQIAWFARLEDEHDNLRAALAFALDSDDPSSALRLAVGVRGFWQIHGYLVEGRQALESALAATPDVPSELRAKALNLSGILAGEQGEFDTARLRFRAALEDAHVVGSTHVISSALVNLGNLAFFGGDLDAARDLFKESIEYFASLDDIRGQALAKENVGLMALTADDVPEAVTWLTAALELAREVGDDREIGAASRSLAAAMIELGDSAQATSLLAESLALARELGEPHGIAVCLDTFAGLAATAGEVDRAATLFGASDAARASIGAQRQPDHQILYDRWLARTLAHLDTDTYSSHYEDGRSLTLDEACSLALGRDSALIP